MGNIKIKNRELSNINTKPINKSLLKYPKNN